MEKVRILITGDYFINKRTETLADQGDYANIFGFLHREILDSDLSITNLEAPFTNSKSGINKTGPNIKSKPSNIAALKYSGFNLVTLANNHIMDYGRVGLEDSLSLLNSAGIKYVGAGMNLKEASRIYYTTINTIKLAIVNIAENEWATTHSDVPGAHPLDVTVNYKTLKDAKANADIVLLIVHGGHEMYPFPSPRMKATYRFFADAGADVIIGHHTHCYSGYEKYEKSHIFYSLGNLLYDLPHIRDKRWYTGFAVQLDITREGMDFNLIPFRQNDDKPGLHELNKTELKNFREDIDNINSIIADDVQLKSKFDAFCRKKEKLYWSYLEPHSSKYITALRNRGLFPRLSSKKKRLYKNIISCEAHRDVLLNLLSR